MNNEKQVLVLVAHADDETIGCGGYIHVLVQNGFQVTVVIASDCMVRRKGDIFNNKESAIKACNILGVRHVYFLDLVDQEFEKYPTQFITGKIMALNLKPTLIISHSSSDLNRDHRVIHEIALLVGRSIQRQICIIGAEIVCNHEYFGGTFHPNYYVGIEEAINVKTMAFQCYGAEVRDFPHPYSQEGLIVKAKQRGMEVGLPFAEAFHVIRWFSGVFDEA